MKYDKGRGVVSRVLGVLSDALNIKIGQEIYVIYRATSRNRPHVKRARVVQCQATMADKLGEITLLCEDYAGSRYVYRYDDVILDLNDALRFVTAQSLKDDMGIDEFCRLVDPNFRYKRKKDGDEASASPRFDPSRKVDEATRKELLERVMDKASNPNYWKDGHRK